MLTKTVDQIGDEDWTETLANALGEQVTLYSNLPHEKVQHENPSFASLSNVLIKHLNTNKHVIRYSIYVMLLHSKTVLALTVLVATIDAQWEGMGDVRSARYEPALLPPCPTIRVLSYSNW